MKSYMGGHVAAAFRRIFWFTSTLGQNRVPKVADTIPNGYLVVYVGEDKKRRFVIPVAYVNHTAFQGMLKQAEEEFGFSPPWGGLTLPCPEDIFVQVTSCLDAEFSEK